MTAETPLVITDPRISLCRDGDRLRIRLQDPQTKVDIAIVTIPIAYAALMADEIRSVTP